MIRFNLLKPDEPRVFIEPLLPQEDQTTRRSFLVRTGFTLVELAVAVAIIGILAAGAMAFYMKSMTEKARNATAEKTASSLRSAVSAFTAKTLNSPRLFNQFVNCGSNQPAVETINLNSNWTCQFAGLSGGSTGYSNDGANTYDTLILNGLGKLANLVIRYQFFSDGRITYNLQ